MAEAKSKRDLIWEEKRRQREERLLSNFFIRKTRNGGSNAGEQCKLFLTSTTKIR